MSTILRKDPIVEAVCDFHFASKHWDWTVPGLLFPQIKNDFPMREQQKNIQFEVEETPKGLKAHTDSTLARMQFWRDDRTALVQLGPNHLSINQLRPYTGWPNFKAMIERVLSLYEQASPFEKINVMSLRYINHLPLPGNKRFKFDELINTYPRVPGDETQTWGTWVQKVDIVREDLSAVFAVQSGCVPEPPSEKVKKTPAKSETVKLMLILDLTFRHYGPNPIDRGGVSAWLDMAHEQIENMFFDSIQPDYLKTFKPEEADAN